MAGIFNAVVNAGKSALEKIQSHSDPNTVKSINPGDFAPVPVQDREDCMLLYGPRTVKVKKEEMSIFDICCHSDKYPNVGYSLCRLDSKDEAKKRFKLYQHIPLLLTIDRDLCNASSLQAICDVIRQNSSLSPAHIAVQLDLRAVLQHSSLDEMLNAQDNAGVTPAMIAVKKKNDFALKHLMAKNVDLSLMDDKRNNVFHYAASSSKDIIDILGEKPHLLKERNGEGFTPLHIACHEDLPDCVQALLCAGADVNIAGTMDNEQPLVTAVKSSSARCVKEILQMYPKQLHAQDIKNGGTPLHWAKNKEIAVALIEAGCHIDAKNFNGDTALHLACHHGRLECVMALVSNGAQIDLKDQEGNTPLHLACQMGHDSLVKALLVFDADYGEKNEKNETAFQVALNKASDSSMMDFKDRKGIVFAMYAIGANGDHELPEKFKQSKKASKVSASPVHKRTRILFDDVLANAVKKGQVPDKGQIGGRLLSLDGGGIKGLVLTRMLLSLEKAFEVPIMDCFDWVAGTSTGAILALALATGKSVLECQSLYFRLKDQVFVDSKPYATKPLEDLLQQTFGLKKMKEITRAKVVVTATMADRSPPDLQLFRNYQAPIDILGVNEYEHPELATSRQSSPIRTPDTLVWRAARASGAAPSFFRPEGSYVDGGIIANNPSLDLLTEISEYNIAQRVTGHQAEVVQPSVLLSLGTGVPPVRKTQVVDIFRPDNAGDTLKLIMNWDGMGKMILESVLDADGPIVDRCRAWCASTGTAYYRFSPLMADEIELDEKDDKILVDLMWSAMMMVHLRSEDVARLKSLLCPNQRKLPSLQSMELE